MKKLTKEQKLQKEKDALRQRVQDIYSGATGDVWGEDDFSVGSTLSKVVPVFKKLFYEEGNEYLFAVHNLERYDNVESATEFLFDNGVRA